MSNSTLQKCQIQGATFYFENVIEPDYCKIVLSSYMNILAHAAILESSNVRNNVDSVPDTKSFIEPEVSEWNKDPLLQTAFDINLISSLTGKGKGTQFCFTPEKDQLIIGNYKVYDLFATHIYKTPFLLIQPSGFMVFPSHPREEYLPWVQKNFLQSSSIPTFSAFAVLESDQDHVFSHSIETLDAILEHRELLKVFFDSEKGHPSHRLALCSGRSPFVLPKTFNLDIYNEFREIYNELHENPNKYRNLEKQNVYVAFCKELLSLSEDRPKPVHTKLEWIKRFIWKGSIFAWDDRIPYRFRCFRAPTIFPQNQPSGNPLICVELNFIPIAHRTTEEIKGDAVAFANKTVSPNPIRNASFIKKYGNRFEKQVVRLMNCENGKYESPFVVNGDYWTCLSNPLLFALKGIDENSKPFLWTDFEAILSASTRRSYTNKF